LAPLCHDIFQWFFRSRLQWFCLGVLTQPFLTEQTRLAEECVDTEEENSVESQIALEQLEQQTPQSAPRSTWTSSLPDVTAKLRKRIIVEHRFSAVIFSGFVEVPTWRGLAACSAAPFPWPTMTAEIENGQSDRV
jgi:hypothetical protein